MTAYTICTACQENIPSHGEEQRVHYRSERHLYNTHRKLEGALPISAEVWEKKLQRFAEIKAMQAKQGKKMDHVKEKNREKKNGKNQKLNQGNGSNAKAKSVDDDTVSESGTSVTDSSSNVTSNGTTNQVNKNIPLSHQSLFDIRTFSSVEKNLEHMRKNYSFTIPNPEYCKDLGGLMKFLHQKINKGHQCLFCDKVFESKKFCVQHMIDKGHCRIGLEGYTRRGNYSEENTEELQLQLAPFYDFSESFKEIVIKEKTNNKDHLNSNSSKKLEMITENGENNDIDNQIFNVTVESEKPKATVNAATRRAEGDRLMRELIERENEKERKREERRIEKRRMRREEHEKKKGLEIVKEVQEDEEESTGNVVKDSKSMSLSDLSKPITVVKSDSEKLQILFDTFDEDQDGKWSYAEALYFFSWLGGKLEFESDEEEEEEDGDDTLKCPKVESVNKDTAPKSITEEQFIELVEKHGIKSSVKEFTLEAFIAWYNLEISSESKSASASSDSVAKDISNPHTFGKVNLTEDFQRFLDDFEQISEFDETEEEENEPTQDGVNTANIEDIDEEDDDTLSTKSFDSDDFSDSDSDVDDADNNVTRIECDNELDFQKVVNAYGLRVAKILDDTGNLLLPDGSEAGHRELNYIYKQRGVRREPEKKAAALRGLPGGFGARLALQGRGNQQMKVVKRSEVNTSKDGNEENDEEERDPRLGNGQLVKSNPNANSNRSLAVQYSNCKIAISQAKKDGKYIMAIMRKEQQYRMKQGISQTMINRKYTKTAMTYVGH